MTLEYKQSLSELNIIFGYMDESLLDKIPQKIFEFVNKNRDRDYVPDIKKNIPINEQDLKKDTKVLLSILYRNYLCDEETKKRLLEEDKIAIEEYRRSHNNFEETIRETKSIEQVSTDEQVQIIDYEKPKWYKVLFDKIKAIFKK